MRMRLVVAVGTALLVGAAAASAQPAVEFYRDKQIRLVIGWSPGGDYDLGARLVAKYWVRHIPGHPSLVVQNMPGAESINAANFLYNQAPKDGSVIGVFGRNLPAQAVLGNPNMRFDPQHFGWIGGAGLPAHVCVARTDSGVDRAQDLFSKELLVAGIGARSSPSLIAQTLNTLLGTRLKVVTGYASSADVMLALQRGEVSGLCHSWTFFRNLYSELLGKKLVHVLLHTEESALPELPDIPSAFDFAKTDDDRKMLRFLTSSAEFGRPFLLPPDAPAERLAVLRDSLAATLADPELLAESEKLKIDVTHRPGALLEQLVADIHATPRPLLERAAALMPSD